MPRRITVGAAGVLFATGAGGAVAVMNAGSAGSAIRTASLNGPPGDLVVDSVSGHAFVVLSQADSLSPTGSVNRFIAVVDTRTGALLRTVDPGVDEQSLELDPRAHRLVVSGNGRAALLDTRRGSVVYATGATLPASSVALDLLHGHTIVVGDGFPNPGAGLYLTVLDSRTGLPLHKARLSSDQPIQNSLTVDDAAGRIVVASTSLVVVKTSDSAVSNVNALERVTTLDLSGRVIRTVAVGQLSGPTSNGLSIVPDRRRRRALVLDADTSTVSVLDERTGSLIRATSLVPRRPKRRAIIYNSYLEAWAVDEQSGRLFVATPPRVVCTASRGCNPVGPGNLDTFDTQTGRLARTTAVPDARSMVVDPHAGRVLVSSYSSGAMTVSIVDAGAGRLLRTIGPSSAPWGQLGSDPVVDAGTDRAYISGGNGTLSVLDIRDGRVIQTLPLGGQYDRLALDEQTHRIILVGEASAPALADPWGWMPGWLRSRIAFIPPPPHPSPAPPTNGKVATLDIPG